MTAAFITEQGYVTPMNGFDIGHKSKTMGGGSDNQQLVRRLNSDSVQTVETYNPEIDKKPPTTDWELDVKGLMSSDLWLKQYGLKRNRLDANNLIAQIGFKRIEEFDQFLKKPVSSKYGESVFLRHTRDDGRIYNVTANKEKLQQIENRLRAAIHLYKRRLQWLTTESRRIFGVIQEHCTTIILDIKNLSPRAFDTYLCAVEKILKEQIINISKFNLIRCAEQVVYFAPQCVSVSKDNIQSAIDWLWQLDRLAATGPSNTVEAVIRATADPHNEAIYLFTEGSSSDQSREILKGKLSTACNVPFNVISYNCTNHDTLSFLKFLAEVTGGYFHAYGITMEVDSYEGMPLDNDNNKANIVIRRKLYGGVPSGSGVRRDVLAIFEELEEAQNTLAQIQVLISQTPDPKPETDIRVEHDPLNAETRREEYMTSKEWLSKYGMDARRLDFYDILAGVCFRHCDGVVDVMHAPPEAAEEPHEQHDALITPRLVNAKYCDKFAHVKWKDGQIVHVQVTPEVHRMYEQRMEVALKAIERRMDFLRQGSRELFGTIVEEQLYILLDTSASMGPSIGYVKDKLYTLMQDQIRHKTKVNFVAFNNKAYPWKDRLVDVSEANLTAAWNWVKALSCFGTTNTLAALRFALADRQTHAIYLLSDGRPDQIPESILSQVQFHNRVPVHTISFNCSDREANVFLCKLARETGGRFHIFSENGEIPEDDGIEPWESEDIRALKQEYDRGVFNLEKVARLREECQRLAWNKSTTHNGPPKTRPVTTGYHSSSTGGGVALPPPEFTYKKSAPHQRCRSRSPGVTKKRMSHRKLLSASMTSHSGSTQQFRAGHTKSSILRSMSSGGRFVDDEWMLPEHRNMMQRQTERLTTRQKAAAERRHKKKTKKMTDESTMSARCWLKKFGLQAKKMTILDALAPTVVNHRPKYVPIFDKNVLSKVFDEILPLAHVSSKDRQNIKLVNPMAVDLAAYRKKLDDLIHKYTEKLNNLVWDGLPADEVNRIRNELGDDVELDYMTHKVHAVQAMEACGWPVAEEEIMLLEQEIELARKYYSQAEELEKASREKGDPESAREVLTDIQQQEQPQFEGLAPAPEMPTKTGRAVRIPDLDPGQKPAQSTPRGVKAVLDSLRGQRIVARNQEDGLYYAGQVVRCPNVRTAEVKFNDLECGTAEVPTRFCIPISGAVSRPLLRNRDPVLVRVNNVANRLVCYAPGIITGLPGSQRTGSKFYTVKLYTGQKCCSLRADVLKIGETRYNFLIKNLQDRFITAEIEVDVEVPPAEESRRSRSASGDRDKRGSSSDERTRQESQKQEAEREEKEREKTIRKEQKRQRRREGDKKLREELESQKMQLEKLGHLLEQQKRDMSQERHQMREDLHKKREEKSERKSAASRTRTKTRTPRSKSASSSPSSNDGEDRDSERPPSRRENRSSNNRRGSTRTSAPQTRNSEEPELTRLVSVSQVDDLAGSDEETHLRAPRKPKIEVGEEVLSRWLDDGWYYRGIVKEDLEDGSYMIEDSCGDADRFWEEDIIKETDDSRSLVEVASTLIALHPAYSYSYAPAVAISVAGDLSVNVRFYDGEESRLPRVECYSVSSDVFESAVRYINECEKKWVGQAVVARDDSSGEYHLGVVKQRIGNGKQYVIQWSNGERGVQQAGYLFGAFSRRHQFRAGDRVLACSDRRRLVYLPGWVVSVHPDTGKLTVKFIDGTSLHEVDTAHTFWLSLEFYDAAVAFCKSSSKSARKK